MEEQVHVAQVDNKDDFRIFKDWALAVFREYDWRNTPLWGSNPRRPQQVQPMAPSTAESSPQPKKANRGRGKHFPEFV